MPAMIFISAILAFIRISCCTQSLLEIDENPFKAMDSFAMILVGLNRACSGSRNRRMRRLQSVREENGSPTKIFDMCKESVVHIRTDIGSGSGVVWDKQSHIATNAHVVKGSDFIEVIIGEASHKAHVVAIDNEKDIAVLRLDDLLLSLRPIGKEPDLKIEIGQFVYAIGFPGEQQMLTQGVISGKGVPGPSTFQISDFFIDAHLNPGNSGGALVNEEGNMIGMPRGTNWDGCGMGIGVVIPMSVLHESISEMIEWSNNTCVVELPQDESDVVLAALRSRGMQIVRHKCPSKDLHIYYFHADKSPETICGLILKEHVVTLKAIFDRQDDLRALADASLSQFVNEWNLEVLFTKAYIDGDGDLLLEMDLIPQSMTSLNEVLPEAIDIFRTSVLQFVDKLFNLLQNQ